MRGRPDLEVGTNTGKINHDRDVGALQEGRRADAAALEDLRGVQVAGGEDDLGVGADGLHVLTVGGAASLYRDARRAFRRVEEDFVHAVASQQLEVRPRGNRRVVSVDRVRTLDL